MMLACLGDWAYQRDGYRCCSVNRASDIVRHYTRNDDSSQRIYFQNEEKPMGVLVEHQRPFHHDDDGYTSYHGRLA